MSARGRKPRTAEDGELRQHTVAVRLSPAEYARVVRAAGDAPLGTWAHRVVLGATEPVPVAGRAIDLGPDRRPFAPVVRPVHLTTEEVAEMAATFIERVALSSAVDTDEDEPQPLV